jgi:transcriptional regulator with XRE-family HTH domain
MRIPAKNVRTCTQAELAKKLRAHRGLRTQAQVASAAGKKTATYTFWEGARSEPGALSLARACLFLGCTPNDVLLTEDGAAETKLPPEVHGELLEISRMLIHLHDSGGNRNGSSPIKVMRQFLADFSRSLHSHALPQGTNGRARHRRKKMR